MSRMPPLMQQKPSKKHLNMHARVGELLLTNTEEMKRRGAHKKCKRNFSLINCKFIFSFNVLPTPSQKLQFRIHTKKEEHQIKKILLAQDSLQIGLFNRSHPRSELATESRSETGKRSQPTKDD